MSENNSGNIKYILSTIKSSFLPAVIFAGVLALFYAQNPYDDTFSLSLHIAFLIFSALGTALLFTVNISKPFFSFLLGIMCYLGINWLKSKMPESWLVSPEFLCLCFALPLNLTIFYFLPSYKLRSAAGRYMLLFILAQTAIIQHYGNFILQIPHIDVCMGAIPLWAAGTWLVFFLPIFLDISIKNTIINTGLFYTGSSLFLGMIYADSPSGLTTFSLGFSLILCCTTVLELFHRYHYDTLENVGSAIAYQSHADTKFPYKYTIGLFSIDNRDKLLKVIGTRKMQILEQMLVNKIRELPQDIALYRYNAEELIIVFKNENAKHTQEYADNLRRMIAASDFVLSSKKSLKITISICISEKTRKDLYASEVTTRAHNMLQKTYRFNCNITTKA